MFLTLHLLDDTFAVCQFAPDSAIPLPALTGELVSITRTRDELSLVCPQHIAPPTASCERDWRCLKVAGPLDFTLVGVLASLVAPLAEAGISVFVLSTFDTDYLLIKQDKLDQAIEVLRQAGHAIY